MKHVLLALVILFAGCASEARQSNSQPEGGSSGGEALTDAPEGDGSTSESVDDAETLSADQEELQETMLRQWSCSDAPSLRDQICALAERICDISQRHPESSESREHCVDARERCETATSDVHRECCNTCSESPRHGVSPETMVD